MIYYEIAFLQGEEADEVFNILEKSKLKALQHLREWSTGELGEGSDKPFHGANDSIKKYKTGENTGYILSWNYKLQYAGLEAYKDDKDDKDGNTLT